MEIRPDEFQTFADWFGPALQFFLIAVPLLAAVAFAACYIFATVRHGPVEAFYAVAKVIATAVGKDFPQTRLGRTLAIARLTIKEAVRRRVIVAFVIFAIILLFAGWFLDVQSDDPAHIYLSFVLTTTNYLVLVLALFLSAFSLPADIKSRTIHTVVTKPVRASEIVLGRVLGFAAVGSALLVVMCVVSYIFVVRGVDHEHRMDEKSLVVSEASAQSGSAGAVDGLTTNNSYHRHTWTLDAEGNGRTDNVMGHQHVVTRKDGGEARDASSYEIGAPRGALQARVPIYGELSFTDREGNPSPKGINVGKEWEYRSYIEGRTLQTAIWSFKNLKKRDFPDGLPVALTLGVFRTYKADIETGVRGIIIVRSPNPRKRIQCEPIGFESQEYVTQQLLIPRKLRPVGEDGTSGREIDLFDDLLFEGELEIMVRCDDRSQYFGMAQADFYIQAANAPFWWNFVKGYIGIWLQMLVVTCLGVTFSTILSAPVAILATVSAILLGMVGQFVRELWTGEAYGGGPIESIIRIVTQENMIQPLDIGTIPMRIIQWADYILVTLIHVCASLLPNFAGLGRTTAYVAYNFNVYGDLLARHCLTTFVYVLAITIVGYFFLRTREIAA